MNKNPYIVERRKKKLKINIIQVILLISLVLLWELLSKFNIIDSFLFSSPSRIFDILVLYVKNGELWKHIEISVIETFRFCIISQKVVQKTLHSGLAEKHFLIKSILNLGVRS